jgi:hypothetical protein
METDDSQGLTLEFIDRHGIGDAEGILTIKPRHLGRRVSRGRSSCDEIFRALSLLSAASLPPIGIHPKLLASLA